MSSFTKSGTKQWVFQRVSNALIVIFSIILFAMIATNPIDNLATFQQLIAPMWFKAFASICLVIFAVNSVIAGWQIAGDYVKATGVNRLFNGVCVIMSIVATLFGLALLW